MRFGISMLFCAALAVHLDLTDLHQYVNADSVVVYLVGLLKWSPFFWGQDRFGMLLPLLALPISDPWMSVIVQNFLHLVLFFMVFFLWPRVLATANDTEAEKSWLAAGLLGIGIFLALGDLKTHLEYLSISQIYTTALVFGLLTLLTAPRRIYLAIPLSIITSWCNFIVGVFLLAYSVIDLALNFRSIKTQSKLPIHRNRLFALAAGSVVGWFIRQPYATKESQGYAIGNVENLAHGFEMLIVNQWSLSATLLVLPPVVALTAGIVCAIRKGSLKSRALKLQNLLLLQPYIKIYAVPLITIFVFMAAVAMGQLPEWAGYPARYMIPCILLWISLNAAVTIRLLMQRFRCLENRYLMAMCMLTIFMIVGGRYGLPSPGAAHASLQSALAPAGTEPLRLRCTHVVGDYYRIWPTVLFARLNDTAIWGVGNRSMETRPDYELNHFAQPRICMWKDNLQEANTVMNARAMRTIDESSTMIVLAP